MKFKPLLSLFFFLFTLPTLSHAADSYDYLAGRIVSQAKTLKNKKIAILPPVYLGKEPSSAPEIVAERLTTGIVQKGGVQVIERGLISKLLSEANLAMTGVIDEAAGRNVGKILKVDAIVTGTLNDVSQDQVEINIRLITADEGKVLVAAGKTVQRTWPQVADLKPPKPKIEETPKPFEVKSPPQAAQAPPPPTIRGENTNRTAYFVGSKNSNKYHLPSCTWAKRINPGNLVVFKSREDAQAKGYVPCKVCRP